MVNNMREQLVKAGYAQNSRPNVQKKGQQFDFENFDVVTEAEKAIKGKNSGKTGTEFIRAAMRLPFLYSKKWRMTSEISDCRKALCRYGFGGGIGRR